MSTRIFYAWDSVFREEERFERGAAGLVRGMGAVTGETPPPVLGSATVLVPVFSGSCRRRATHGSLPTAVLVAAGRPCTKARVRPRSPRFFASRRFEIPLVVNNGFQLPTRSKPNSIC
jgi:hypothetical protein